MLNHHCVARFLLRQRLSALPVAIAFMACSSNHESTRAAAAQGGGGGADTISGLLLRESSDFGSITRKEQYSLINNVWNKGAATGDYSQEVFVAQDTKGQEYWGWSWDWTGGSNVVAYPEVRYGDSPWDSIQVGKTKLPLAVTQANFRVDLDIELEATGTYDMAFDLWVIRGLPNTKESISAEVMIWTADESPHYWGWTQALGSASVDGRNYQVYTKKNHVDESGANDNQWAYIAFVPNQRLLQGQVHVQAYLDYLVQAGLIQSTDLLSCIELGNEVWTGKGTTKLLKYQISQD